MKVCDACGQKIVKEERNKVQRDDIAKVITIFKMAQGFEKDDKGWDRMYFSRYTKSAKQLLEFIGNWEDAADCVQEIYEKFAILGLTVTFETINKHAAEWKKDNFERMEKIKIFNMPKKEVI